MASVSVQIFDITNGQPARGAGVCLERRGDRTGTRSHRRETDELGCVTSWGTDLEIGPFSIVIAIRSFFAALGLDSSQDSITICTRFDEPGERRHILVLAAPHGHSTHIGRI